jgi:hypothetical protein
MLGIFSLCFNVYNQNNLKSCCYCIPECDDGPRIHVPICPTRLILEPVLEIRDILERIRLRTRGSILLTNGPDPDPDPDPTPFFCDLRTPKKKISPNLFLITYPQAHYLQS